MDSEAKKTALRMIPYGLFVLTTTGERIGTGTVNWVSQMSFQPPLVALGVKKDSQNFANIKAGGAIALSALGTGQGDLAFAFFGDVEVKGETFVSKDKSVPFERTTLGTPVLTEAPAWLEVKLVDTIETGDHAVVVAEVIDAGLREQKPQVLTLKELGLNYGG